MQRYRTPKGEYYYKQFKNKGDKVGDGYLWGGEPPVTSHKIDLRELGKNVQIEVELKKLKKDNLSTNNKTYDRTTIDIIDAREQKEMLHSARELSKFISTNNNRDVQPNSRVNKTLKFLQMGNMTMIGRNVHRTSPNLYSYLKVNSVKRP